MGRALLAGLILSGCEAPDPAPRDAGARRPARAADAAPAKASAPAKGKGTLRGRVVFRGKVPPVVPVPIAGRDAARCQAAKAYYEREVIVGADGGLSEVLVAIQGLRRPADHAPAEVEVEIGGCAFRPRVVHATVGDTLVIESHDDILSLPLIPDQSSGFQTAFLKGQRHPRPLPRAGGFRMTDSLGTHEWMYAHLLVLTHPFHAVTSETGRFEFTEVPEGPYRLNLWHPKLGEKGEPFSVRAGGTTDVEVVYEPAAPEPAKAPGKTPAKLPPGPD